MINPTSDDAKALVLLAERMGIPSGDAVRRVLSVLNDLETDEASRMIRAAEAGWGGAAATARRVAGPVPTTGSSASG
jgi:hypothetical protein